MRRDDGHTTVLVPQGSYGEQPEFEIWLNAFVQADFYRKGERTCRHAGPFQTEQLTHGKEKGYRLPRLVVAWNQGGHDVTGVCADCIAEALVEAGQ
jgi:hypothetical protein